MDSMPLVQAVLILDNEGERIFARFFDTEAWPNHSKQEHFEKQLYKKHSSIEQISPTSMCIVGNSVSVYKAGEDVTIHIVGSTDCNEIALLKVLELFYHSCENLLHGLQKSEMLENYEVLVFLTDEILDDGIILCPDEDSTEVLEAVRAHVNDLSDRTGRAVRKFAVTLQRSL